MSVQPNLLIVGSTGRNIGKTEFACGIIEAHAGNRDIYGVKVIPVDRGREKCHRGPEGCGLCDSLTGDFEIIEEKDKQSAKDTARMLKSGARKAYLLIVERRCLERGIRALLKMMPEKVLVVIESNTIRKVIEPGLFIVIKKKSETKIKPSCAEVIGFADKIVEFYGMKWDFSPEQVLIRDERWTIAE